MVFAVSDEVCGLRLSDEKTRITHVRDGLDFLGFRLLVGPGKSGRLVPKIRVGPKAITNIQRRLGEAVRHRPSQESLVARVTRGSAIIRGWSNYFSIAHNYSKVASSLDHKSFWITVKTICRKQDISTAQCLRKYDQKNILRIYPGCSLARFSDTKMSLDYRGPRPYQPGQGVYSTDTETEVDFRLSEKCRPGRADLKWQALIRDGYYCRGCGVRVTTRSSHADHIEPVHRFASFHQANHLDNIQTLCRPCHKLKTHRKKE